jgi:hypothetical protein
MDGTLKSGSSAMPGHDFNEGVPSTLKIFIN